MGEVFVSRRARADRRGQGSVGDRLQDVESSVSVHSAFDLPTAQQTAIESAVKETFAPDAQVQFETAPDLISGVELSANGQKVAWSIADYLSTLEKSAGELVHDLMPSPSPSRTRSPSPSQRQRLLPSRTQEPSPVRSVKPRRRPRLRMDTNEQLD